ncbi:uncharacterized protein [Triticum aestivum]|uniref:uncharacterized protein isoform X1 n=1 Tax=Triticum aestivum TaxID=4565 RepID=UPI001D02D2DF|nr:uncharacterized protein LOC123146929 isoform X1 [Triticum aestivum]
MAGAGEEDGEVAAPPPPPPPHTLAKQRATSTMRRRGGAPPRSRRRSVLADGEPSSPGMVYLSLDDGGSDEVVEEVGSHMSHHGHLRTVYMSGFRCYNDQVKLAYCILQNARVLEHMEIQPRVAAGNVLDSPCSLIWWSAWSDSFFMICLCGNVFLFMIYGRNLLFQGLGFFANYSSVNKYKIV